MAVVEAEPVVVAKRMVAVVAPTVAEAVGVNPTAEAVVVTANQ